MSDLEMNRWLSEQADKCWHDWGYNCENKTPDGWDCKYIYVCSKCNETISYYTKETPSSGKNFLSPSHLSELIALMIEKGFGTKHEFAIWYENENMFRDKPKLMIWKVGRQAAETFDEVVLGKYKDLSHALAEAFYNAVEGE